MEISPKHIEWLTTQALFFEQRAYVPYSQKPKVVFLILSDGQVVPGVRVENASFQLVIPALINAFSTAVSLGRLDVVSLFSSQSFTAQEKLYITDVFKREITLLSEHFLSLGSGVEVPVALSLINPFMQQNIQTDVQGILLAQKAAVQAQTPISQFPVGAVLDVQKGFYLQGCNVETEDWQTIICAERNILGTAITYGVKDFHKLFLSCPKDNNGTPCGACRQVLVELAPRLQVVMDRGVPPPQTLQATELLPFSFQGETLRL